MNHRKLVMLMGSVVLLAPSMAMANGMVRMVQSFEVTLTGGVVGCIIGVIIALAGRAKLGRLLTFAVVGGLAAGLLAAAMFAVGHIEFFSNNAGILGFLAVIAAGTGVVGGLVAGFIGAGLRALRRGRTERRLPTRSDGTGAGNQTHE